MRTVVQRSRDAGTSCLRANRWAGPVRPRVAVENSAGGRKLRVRRFARPLSPIIVFPSENFSQFSKKPQKEEKNRALWHGSCSDSLQSYCRNADDTTGSQVRVSPIADSSTGAGTSVQFKPLLTNCLEMTCAEDGFKISNITIVNSR